jgi:prepilin-type N-terminal cleavage/methylation domain-containing protein
MKTEKKGFTLIELMVVIVIIGILAAIAIPKLFGMSAKAKASEVGPAAGTWSKLQSAYLMETGTLGKATEISYKVPGTISNPVNSNTSANFKYVVTDPANSVASWLATPVAALGDCPISGSWSATFSADNTVTATVSGGSNNECAALTPNFKNLQ